MSLKEKAKGYEDIYSGTFHCNEKQDTPIIAKILAGITVGYALSPIDLVPDFIPVVGYLDDLIILPLLAALTIKFIPDGIMEECKAEAQGMWEGRKPKKWYYAIPILAVWF